MSWCRKRALSTLLILASTSFAPAQAMNFCVDTASELQAALTSSQSNNQSNLIVVEAGNYPLGAGLTYSSTATNSLTLIGGYSPGCATLVAQASTLDGQGNVRPLTITALNAAVHVEEFDFTGGLSTSNRGGGLSVLGAEVRVERNRFIANRADDYAGALFAYSVGELRVRNNLFIANSAAYTGAAELTGLGAVAYVTSNTVVANSSDAASSPGGAPFPGGIYLGGNAQFNLSNNILWNNNANGAVDLHAVAAHTRLHNDIGTSSGTAPAAGSTGNLSVDPDFAPCEGFLCFNFELKRSSPLVDAGTNSPPAGLTSRDLLDAPRIVGGLVDIGAYELDRLFADGYE